MHTRTFLPLTLFFLTCCGAILPAVAQDKSNPVKSTADQLQATWNFVMVEENGVKQPRQKRGDPFRTISFEGDKFQIKRGDKLLLAGTHKLDASKKPMTIDLSVTDGEGKGTTQLGIFELKGDTLTVCVDPSGKKRPAELKSSADSGFLLAITQRERNAGVDPQDASLVFDKPWQMNSGFKAYNGNAYDLAAVCVDPKCKLVLPDEGTVVERHDKADMLLVYMEKRASIKAHFVRSVSIADYRQNLGCAVKLEKGALFIGTFGEYGFLEGSVRMKLLVVVPSKVEVERRAGLIGGYGGRAGSERPAKAINPARDDPKPALTKSKVGTPRCWLAPTAEDGWHEIPAVADPERRVSKVENKKQ